MPKPPIKSLASPPPCSQLMTKPQVIAKLRAEIEASSLTLVAQVYDISVSQLSDALRGRANLSKKMLAKMRLRMYEFYGTAK